MEIRHSESPGCGGAAESPERVSSATNSRRRGSASLPRTVGFLSPVELRPVHGEPPVELGQPLGIHERLEDTPDLERRLRSGRGGAGRGSHAPQKAEVHDPIQMGVDALHHPRLDCDLQRARTPGNTESRNAPQAGSQAGLPMRDQQVVTQLDEVRRLERVDDLVKIASEQLLQVRISNVSGRNQKQFAGFSLQVERVDEILVFRDDDALFPY